MDDYRETDPDRRAHEPERVNDPDSPPPRKPRPIRPLRWTAVTKQLDLGLAENTPSRRASRSTTDAGELTPPQLL